TGQAGIVLTGSLTGDLELTLSPVAHDLAAGLTGDHQIGGLVPVLDVGAFAERTSIGRSLEDLGVFRSAGNLGVLVDVDRLPGIQPGDGDGDDTERAGRLPGLIAHGERDLACLAQLGRGGDELVP